MSDIFREVDEEVRRSQAEAVWAKYGNVIILACVVLVMGVAGYRYYDWQRERAAAEAGAKFDAALQMLQSGKGSEGEAALAKVVAEGGGIYKALAQFRIATELGKRDAAAAVKVFDELAASPALDTALRDVARLRAAALAADFQPLADLEQRMTPLLSPNNSWRHAAQEILAAAAIKANNLDKARQYLDAVIIDRDAPAAIKSRAELLIGLTRGAK